MLQLYLLNIEEVRALTPAFCEAHFPERFRQAKKFRFEEDRFRSIAAGVLLWKVLSAEEAEIVKAPEGKLRIPGKPEFNLSHSGSYAVLAVSDTPVGVDIEKTLPPRMTVADYAFTKEELSWMKEAPETRFWMLWTMKEAVCKALGKGLALELKSFSVLPLFRGEPLPLEGQTFTGAVLYPEGYILSLVSSGGPEEITAEYIKLSSGGD